VIVDFSYRGWWTTVHGVVLGGLFMLALVVVLWQLVQLRDEDLTAEGAAARLRWLRRALVFTAVISITTAVVGTWVVDPWFHQHVAGSPLLLLDARPKLTFWTDVVLEWKERVSWTAALCACAAAYITVYYGDELLWHSRVRRLMLAFFGVALGGALAAGAMGMLLTKIVPVT
jgi:hypothetical protein